MASPSDHHRGGRAKVRGLVPRLSRPLNELAAGPLRLSAAGHRGADVHRLDAGTGDRTMHARVVGSFPALNARRRASSTNGCTRSEALAAWDREHPDRPAAPFAVNQIVHRSNDRFEPTLRSARSGRCRSSSPRSARARSSTRRSMAGAGSRCTTSSTTALRARRSTRAPTALSPLLRAPAGTPGAGRRSR